LNPCTTPSEEGSFGFSITRHPEMTCGYNVQLKIHITQSTHSVNVLHEIKNFFKCGTVLPHNRTGDRIRYQITSIVDIVNILIPFLELHPLLTSKFLNYQDFKKAVELIMKKEHLTLDGIYKLIEIKKNINKGRSFQDKWLFCSTHCNIKIITPEWIQGFCDGESCFGFYLKEDKKYPKYLFDVSQNTHDVAIFEQMQKYFNCGKISPKRMDNTLETAINVNSMSHFTVRTMSDINDVIIPFFDKYPLLTNKYYDYEDWKILISMTPWPGQRQNQVSIKLRTVELKCFLFNLV